MTPTSDRLCRFKRFAQVSTRLGARHTHRQPADAAVGALVHADRPDGISYVSTIRGEEEHAGSAPLPHRQNCLDFRIMDFRLNDDRLPGTTDRDLTARPALYRGNDNLAGFDSSIDLLREDHVVVRPIETGHPFLVDVFKVFPSQGGGIAIIPRRGRYRNRHARRPAVHESGALQWQWACQVRQISRRRRNRNASRRQF